MVSSLEPAGVWHHLCVSGTTCVFLRPALSFSTCLKGNRQIPNNCQPPFERVLKPGCPFFLQGPQKEQPCFKVYLLFQISESTPQAVSITHSLGTMPPIWNAYILAKSGRFSEPLLKVKRFNPNIMKFQQLK